MAQRRCLPPAYREPASTKSLIREGLLESPRVAQLWREISRRMDELHTDGHPEDPEVVSKDPEILLLMSEIEVELWRGKA